MEHTITIEEFKDRNASVMKTRWVDTEHRSAGEKIYELYDPKNQGELVKESFQEWLCDNRNEITQCIGIALRNHEKSYAEWFRYVDSRSGPDELALYVSRYLLINRSTGACNNCKRLFYGMTQHLRNSMRYLYKKPGTSLDLQ